MKQRIASLVPSATEIIAELLDDRRQLVGVTHECDWPAWVADLPRLVHASDPAILSADPAEVDRQVTASIGQAESLYKIDVELLQQLAPDVVVTQSLCDVCAVSPTELQRALASLPHSPKIVELSPMSLADVLDDVERTAAALGAAERGLAVRRAYDDRLLRIKERPAIDPAPRVLALEWPDPLWAGGHWVPEMIHLAGGVCVAGDAGKPSTRLAWEDARAAKPDFVLILCCGYGIERNAQQYDRLARLPGWNELPAVQTGRVYALDSNSYFSRPSPRLVEGVERLAELFRGGELPSSFGRQVPGFLR
jgi:iron complex transport system substrate-binding protein